MSKLTFPQYTNPIFEMIGYEPKTTFWSDFSIAECYGVDSVKDTYNRAKEEWKDNIEYMTELALVVNHKSWQYAQTNDNLSKVYVQLWEEVDSFIFEHFKGNEEAISYYVQTTD